MDGNRRDLGVRGFGRGDLCTYTHTTDYHTTLGSTYSRGAQGAAPTLWSGDPLSIRASFSFDARVQGRADRSRGEAGGIVSLLVLHAD